MITSEYFEQHKKIGKSIKILELKLEKINSYDQKVFSSYGNKIAIIKQRYEDLTAANPEQLIKLGTDIRILDDDLSVSYLSLSNKNHRHTGDSSKIKPIQQYHVSSGMQIGTAYVGRAEGKCEICNKSVDVYGRCGCK